MKTDLVSIIVTTKNEETNIDNCLVSIKDQSYKDIEMIVVDNGSKDKTKEISKTYTKNVYDKGPERSAQRNYGVEKSKGKYLLFIDADMILTKDVIRDCVHEIEKKKVGGIIIPEESFGVGIWAQAKALERSFYVGNDLIEAARFYKRDIFIKVKGFDIALTGPEDWDLSQKIRSLNGLSRIHNFIRHNEGHLSLLKTLQKKYYYAKKLKSYSQISTHQDVSKQQLNPFARYMLFFKQPDKLFKNPLLSIIMLFMKTCEMGAGFIGIYFQ